MSNKITHYYVGYITTVGKCNGVYQATKLYAESVEAATAKVMSWGVDRVTSVYDLGD